MTERDLGEKETVEKKEQRLRSNKTPAIVTGGPESVPSSSSLSHAEGLSQGSDRVIRSALALGHD